MQGLGDWGFRLGWGGRCVHALSRQRRHHTPDPLMPPPSLTPDPCTPPPHRRFDPLMREVVDELCTGKLSQEQFPYIRCVSVCVCVWGGGGGGGRV